MHTAVLLRRPAWQRRASVVLLPAIVLTAIALVRYPGGGGRVVGSGFGGLSGPATIGEEFHAGAPLGATGGEIEVIKVRPVGVEGVEVTYRAGLLRQRTARLDGPICIDASSDPKAPLRESSQCRRR